MVPRTSADCVVRGCPFSCTGQIFISKWEAAGWGDWSAHLTPQKATPDSLRTLNIYIVKCHCNVQPGRHNEPLVEHRHPRGARGTDYRHSILCMDV
jgi:hypothetical protein